MDFVYFVNTHCNIKLFIIIYYYNYISKYIFIFKMISTIQIAWMIIIYNNSGIRSFSINIALKLYTHSAILCKLKNNNNIIASD